MAGALRPCLRPRSARTSACSQTIGVIGRSGRTSENSRRTFRSGSRPTPLQSSRRTGAHQAASPVPQKKLDPLPSRFRPAPAKLMDPGRGIHQLHFPSSRSMQVRSASRPSIVSFVSIRSVKVPECRTQPGHPMPSVKVPKSGNHRFPFGGGAGKSALPNPAPPLEYL